MAKITVQIDELASDEELTQLAEDIQASVIVLKVDIETEIQTSFPKLDTNGHFDRSIANQMP